MVFDPFELDERFAPAGYCFVLGALNEAMAAREEAGHVSGHDICVAFRDGALERFGLMTRTVLEHWGFSSTADIGAAVFILAEAGVLRTAEDDTIDEFEAVYDFAEFDTYNQARGFSAQDANDAANVFFSRN